MGGSATPSLRSRAVPYRRGDKQKWPTSGRKCYISPTVSGVPKQGDKVKGGPQVGRSATSALQSRGSPKKETKSKVAHKWAEVLHQPYDLGGPQTRGQSQRWPTSGRRCYISPAFSGGPLQKGRQTKVAHKRAECYISPTFSGGPQTRGQSQRWPTSGRKCYVIPAISGVPKQGDKVTTGPQVGGSATSALQSRGSPNKGTKSKVAHKWAEVLRQRYDLGGTQKRRQSQRWAKSVRKCYVTPAFWSGPLRKGTQTKVAHKRAEVLHLPYDPPNKGTKSKVAHKWAEVLHHPCVLGGPQTRGRNQRWPTSGRKCYISPTISGVAEQGDKVKGGPQVGGSATPPVRSRVVPYTRGSKQKWPTKERKCYVSPTIWGVPKKGDKVKSGPQVGGSATSPLRSRAFPYGRGRKQKWPTKGRKCYIIPTFSGVPKQGGKAKGGPQLGGGATSPVRSRTEGERNKSGRQVGGSATSPLRSLGSRSEGDGNKSGPQVGGSATSPMRSRAVPKQGDKVKCGPQVGTTATSPLISRESPNKGTKSKVAHKWAEVLRHPCGIGGALQKGT